MATQDVLTSVAGEDWWDLDFVISDPLGRPISLPRGNHQARQDLVQTTGFPPEKHHAARYSCGTLVPGIGFSLSTIKDAFGHSSIKVAVHPVSTPREWLRWVIAKAHAAIVATPAIEGAPGRIELKTPSGS